MQTDSSSIDEVRNSPNLERLGIPDGNYTFEEGDAIEIPVWDPEKCSLCGEMAYGFAYITHEPSNLFSSIDEDKLAGIERKRM
ncbi:MAG TPA: hypothetical protein VG944_00250 [Fimbriimonas sp.]|nr:hypothetical protein [Fimbriimonas sp.]